MRVEWFFGHQCKRFPAWIITETPTHDNTSRGKANSTENTACYFSGFPAEHRDMRILDMLAYCYIQLRLDCSPASGVRIGKCVCTARDKAGAWQSRGAHPNREGGTQHSASNHPLSRLHPIFSPSSHRDIPNCLLIFTLARLLYYFVSWLKSSNYFSCPSFVDVPILVDSFDRVNNGVNTISNARWLRAMARHRAPRC